MRRFVILLAVGLALAAALGGAYMTTGSADTGQSEVVSPLLAGCHPVERETLEVEPGDLWIRETSGVVTTYASRQCKGLGIHGIGPEHRIVYEVDPDLVAKATHNTILRIYLDEVNPETGNETVVVWIYKDPWITQQVAKGIVDDEPFLPLYGRRIDSKPVRDVYETLITYGERIRVSRYPIPPWFGEVYSQNPQSGTIKSATIQEIVVWDDALPGEYKDGIRELPAPEDVEQRYAWWTEVRRMTNEEVLEYLRPFDESE